MQENAELFRADVTSPSWKDYINYVDSLVLDGFYCFIRKSLNYLMDNMVADVSYTHTHTRTRNVVYKYEMRLMLESGICGFLMK